MKAGKKGRQAIFHNLACLLLAPLTTPCFLGTIDIPYGFFPGAGRATAKHNNIKEDVQ
jgi:hypothetical protein